MWWHIIRKIKAPAWLSEDKKLRTALLICVGLLCANLLLYGVAITPSAGRLRDLETRYADLRKRHAEAVLFQKQKKMLAGIGAGLPAQKDMPLLVKDLVQTARKLNLKVASVNYDIPKRGSEGLTMLSFSFPAEGSYPSVKRFVYEVETSDRLVGIQDVKLDSEKGRVKLLMKLVTYIKAK
jgi:Tfp pilus assembly protein PilO